MIRNKTTGIVFDIKRFAIHDGPGIRTTVFLKGCPLQCPWCHNPESIQPPPELFRAADKCTSCRICEKACPQNAIEFIAGRWQHNSARCRLCGTCMRKCPADAISIAGEVMTAERVLDIVYRDEPFYRHSGGVTVSGGEPMIQKDFTLAILRGAHERAIRTCLDTTAHCRWDDLAEVLEFTDLVLLDIKFADPARHKSVTGVSNKLIMQNTIALSEANVELVVRVPVIPGYNDDNENINSLTAFLGKLKGISQVELLPYNILASSKYAKLGLPYKLDDAQPPSADRLAEIERILAAAIR